MVPQKHKISNRTIWFMAILGMLLGLYFIGLIIAPIMVKAYYQNIYNSKMAAVEQTKKDILDKNTQLQKESKELCQAWRALGSTKTLNNEKLQGDYDPCLALSDLPKISF